MKKEATIMTMPVKLSIIDRKAKDEDFEDVFSYLRQLEERFSTFKETSETSKLNLGKLSEKDASKEMKKVLALANQTKRETNGFFDVYATGLLDPAGIVKGLAIFEASQMLLKKGLRNFSLEIAGDIQLQGKNENGKSWKIGIENPFNRQEMIKIVGLSERGIATSGNYIKGKHIIDPVEKRAADEIMSITVIGPNVLEADRFATAAFAMGQEGIQFLENRAGLEGLMVTKDKRVHLTSGFERYAVEERGEHDE